MRCYFFLHAGCSQCARSKALAPASGLLGTSAWPACLLHELLPPLLHPLLHQPCLNFLAGLQRGLQLQLLQGLLQRQQQGGRQALQGRALGGKGFQG